MKKIIALMMAVLTVMTGPERYKGNYICTEWYRLCFAAQTPPHVEMKPWGGR